MALKYVLLTLLEREQKTGYEIVKSFETAVGFFWSASHQQVYRELGKLTEQRLVAFKSVAQGDKPDKKIYRITAAGRRDLTQWLHVPYKNPPAKDLLLVKLMNLRDDNADVLLAELDRALERAEERSAIYEGIKSAHYSNEQLVALELKDLALYLALRKGIGAIEAHIKWLHETRAEIANRRN